MTTPSPDKPPSDKASQYRPGVVRNASERFIDSSGRASDVARPIMLTAIAVSWFFAAGGIGEDATPQQVLTNINNSTLLYATIALAILAIVVDLLQYLITAAVWGLYRWSLRLILVADKWPKEFPLRVRLAWFIGRLISVTRSISAATGIPYEATFCDYRPRRDAMREALAPSQRTDRVREGLERSAAPSTFNGVAGTLFWLKIVAIIASYVCMYLYLT